MYIGIAVGILLLVGVPGIARYISSKRKLPDYVEKNNGKKFTLVLRKPDV
jgi:hypothetical protein